MDYRSIIESKYNREDWQSLLHDIFGRHIAFWSHPQPVEVNASMAKEALYTGKITLPDGYIIAIYEVELSDSVVIERNRAGIRNLLCANWRGMGCAGAFMFCFRKNEAALRFSYVSESFSFAPDGSLTKQSTDTKRFTYLLGEGHRCRTAIKQFEDLKNSSLKLKAITDAFSVEALSDIFFKEYKRHYEDIIEYITGKRMVKSGNKWVEKVTGNPCAEIMEEFSCFDDPEKTVRDYVKKLMGRLVFIQFLQKKGWMGCPAGEDWTNGDKEFVQNLFAKTQYKDTFVDDVLEPLFSDLNCKRTGDMATGANYKVPYLNGGLFEEDDSDRVDFPLPAKYMSDLLDFFACYNFTIDENDPDDAEIGIDPEMLGRIFENLLEDNKDKGAFYTPKEIVGYMCREALIAYLQDDKFTEQGNRQIRTFVESLSRDGLNVKQRENLRKKLTEVKICDPAIGSGAFPMGLVNLLSKLHFALGINTNEAAKIKRHIIEQNIYGVDIEKGAVDIARLRFWLAMIVEEDKPLPLPNLHFKIMQGNSLLESYQGHDLSILAEHKTPDGCLDLEYTDAKLLRENLAKYYSITDHTEKEQVFKEIKDNVATQMFEFTQDKKFLGKIKDVSANDQFFLWHTWFADVFDKGGFDIVIGNPPYISTKGVNEADKKKFEREFGFSDDTYNHFTFKGISLCKPGGSLTLIIPKTFWTTQTKRKMRDLLLDNSINYIFDTANPFESAMVDTCIISVSRKRCLEHHKLTFIDGSKSLKTPEIFPPLLQTVYKNTQNSVIFKPTTLNMRIWELYGEKVKELYDIWWPKIKTSKDIEKNKAELEAYRASLKPGDIALLGCLTEGGQGLATANNGKYIAVRRSTKWADKIIASRPKKLAEVISRFHPEISGYNNAMSTSDFLNSLDEKSIAELFDNLKEKYGRDIFGQGYLYKIIDDSEIADVSTLSDDEKKNGISPENKVYVPYDKGDKDGNRWFLETPFAIAWSKENVHYLKTDPKARFQGYKFYFREGLCWSEIKTHYIRCRIKQKTVNSNKSMAFYSFESGLPIPYIVLLLNSEFIATYINNFINNTQTFGIDDARQIFIVIPEKHELQFAEDLLDKAISIKKGLKSDSLDCLQNIVDTFTSQLYMHQKR